MPKGGSVQKKIRDLERFLRKKSPDDPATDKLKLMISNLKEEKQQNIVKEKEKKNAQRYHMVRFFERKKLTRRISKIEKLITAATAKGGSVKDLNRQKKAAEEDLAYVMYFPKASKYMSLFVQKEEKGGDDEKSVARVKQARAAALKAWAEDKKAGNDRVAYAMEVEHNGGEERRASRQYKGAMSMDMASPSKSGDDGDSSKDGDSDSEDSPSEDSSSGDSVDNEGEEYQVTVKRSPSRHEDANSDSESSGSSESETDSVSDDKNTSKKSSVDDSIVFGDNEKSAGSYDLDPFFLEEDDGMDTHQIQQEMHQRRENGRRRTSNNAGARNVRGTGRGGWRSKESSGHGRGNETGKEMTKQEARLAKWQNKQSALKEGRMNGKSSGAAGEESRQNPSRNNTNKRKYNETDSGRRTGRSWNSSTEAESSRGISGGKGSGRGRTGGVKGSSSGKDGTSHDSTAPKQAWEVGGGVSAKYVTAMSQSKLSGGIVTGAASANKKIKFD